MKRTKMSLANIQGKLSRAEMKNIMAGSGCSGSCNYQWKDAQGHTHTTAGTCQITQGLCYCSNGGGTCS